MKRVHSQPAEWLPFSIAPSDADLEVCVMDYEGSTGPNRQFTEVQPGPKYGKRQIIITGPLVPGKIKGNHFAYVEDRSISEQVNDMGRIGELDSQGRVTARDTSYELTFKYIPTRPAIKMSRRATKRTSRKPVKKRPRAGRHSA
jgi:hypothetical protein